MSCYNNAWNGKNRKISCQGRMTNHQAGKRKGSLRKAGQNPGWLPLKTDHYLMTWWMSLCDEAVTIWDSIHWVRQVVPPTAPWFSGKWVPPTRAHFAMNHLTMTGQTRNQMDFPTETYWNILKLSFGSLSDVTWQHLYYSLPLYNLYRWLWEMNAAAAVWSPDESLLFNSPVIW